MEHRHPCRMSSQSSPDRSRSTSIRRNSAAATLVSPEKAEQVVEQVSCPHCDWTGKQLNIHISKKHPLERVDECCQYCSKEKIPWLHQAGVGMSEVVRNDMAQINLSKRKLYASRSPRLALRYPCPRPGCTTGPPGAPPPTIREVGMELFSHSLISPLATVTEQIVNPIPIALILRISLCLKCMTVRSLIRLTIGVLV
jgi:hypothetical protein